MKNLIFFSFLLIASSTYSQLTGVEESSGMEGYWGGTGVQIDKHQWEVDLQIMTSDQVSINYPDLGCSGHWDLIQNGRRKRHYKEVITEGLGKCDQGVDVFVKRISDKKIRLTYYLYSYSDKPIAKAVLKRKPGPGKV
jgi:hypothetical protein